MSSRKLSLLVKSCLEERSVEIVQVPKMTLLVKKFRLSGGGFQKAIKRVVEMSSRKLSLLVKSCLEEKSVEIVQVPKMTLLVKKFRGGGFQKPISNLSRCPAESCRCL